MFRNLCIRFLFFAIVLLPYLVAADASSSETHSITKQIPQRWLIEVKNLSNKTYADSLRAFVLQYNPGGVVYGAGIDLATIAGHQRELQRIASTPLLIGLDVTHDNISGDVLGIMASWAALAATQNQLLIETAAERHASTLRKSGIHLLIMDPFWLSHTRGFGVRQSEAVKAASAYIEGLKAGGINVVVKMTPTAERMALSEELRLLNDLGVMALDTRSLVTHPAAGISDAKGVNKVLRSNKFEQLTMSPWPDEKGLDTDLKSPLSDFLLVSSLRQVEGVFEKRRINKKKQALTVVRIAQHKMSELVKANTDYKQKGTTERVIARQLARESAILLNNTDSLVPFRDLDRKSFAVSFFGEPAGEPAGSKFSSIMAKYAPLTHYGWTGDMGSFMANEARINHFDVYVAAIDLGWFTQLPAEEQIVFKSMLYRLEKQNTRVVAVLFGDIALVPAFSGLKSISYHPVNNEESYALAPQLLFGAYSYAGTWTGPSDMFGNSHSTQAIARLRYEEPWMQNVNLSRLSKIDSLVQDAIKNKAIPGCQVLVARGGTVLYEKSFGYLSYDSLMPVTDNTLYDLASLTKVSATLQMMMKLVEEKKIDLSAPLAAYLPETVGTNKENLVISDVLLHRAGLKPYIPFWEYTFQNRKKNILNPMIYAQAEADEYPVEILPGMYSSSSLKDSVWHWTLKSDLMELPAGKSKYNYKYSDLGFIIIHRLVESVGQSTLDEFVVNRIYKPLGIDEMCFQPLCNYSFNDIAPTELDYYFRKDMIWGTVHDQNAALMGGVAGHAGLFGTANSLAVLLQMHLQKGYYGGRRYYNPETIDLFTRRMEDQDQRALGWDLKDPTNERKNVSFYSSETTYGHTGFTGTAAWVDPSEELIYIFLSNRVHPDANNYKLVESNLRTRIQDVIYQSLEELLEQPVGDTAAASKGSVTSGD